MEEKERQARALSRGNGVSRNPFAQVNRDNFPGFDRALGLDRLDTAVHNKAVLTQKQQQHRNGSFYDDRISPDQSICSQQTTSSFPASSLDMSIGARAALNEHLRHVALHGLDGHQESQQIDQDDTSFERLPQDEMWDRLLMGDGDEVVDSSGNLSIASSAQSPMTPTTTTSSSLLERLQPVVSVMNATDDGDEAVEVELTLTSTAADVSSDYFNSSKIWQLATPEKNKGARRSITTRRGVEETSSLHSYGDGAYSDEDAGCSQESGMMYLYNAAVGMHEQANAADMPTSTEHNASFLSLGVDLSRISNSDVSDIRSSPDEPASYHQYRFTDDFLHQDVLTPSRRGGASRDCSFSTPSRRRGGGLLSPETSATFFSPNRNFPGNAGPTSGGDRENPSVANLSVDIGLSPIAAQAGSIAVKLGRPSRRHHPGDAFPIMSPSSAASCGASPNGLLEKMQGMRMEEPSPISQANSGFDLRNFPVSENCILDMDDKKTGHKSSSKPSLPGLKPRDASFPTGAVAASLSSPISSTTTTGVVDKRRQHSSPGSCSSEDKRRYRTVVPARVFLDDPDHFPYQDDSFSAQSATASSTTTSGADTSSSASSSRLHARSLLVSFDATDEFEVPLSES